MASVAQDFEPEAIADRPPGWMPIAMAATIVAGFSLQLLAGRSTFQSALPVHLHALTFMGWVAIFTVQATLGMRGRIDQHRKLGRLAMGWLVLMIVMGFVITLRMVRAGHVPFFFRPQHFLVFDPLNVLVFTAMVLVAVSMRKRTDWHSRLQLGAMALLMGPAFGRLLPMPLLAPYAYESAGAACALFPLIGRGVDFKRSRRVHPAWLVTLGVLGGMIVLGDIITYSPLGDSLYRMATAGTPGAAVPGLEFGTMPSGGLITGR